MKPDNVNSTRVDDTATALLRSLKMGPRYAPKLRPAVYLKAAKRIALNYDTYRSNQNRWDTCCCDAVAEASGFDYEYQGPFRAMFHPGGVRERFWWATPEDSDKDQQARVLALLFMEQIARDSQ